MSPKTVDRESKRKTIMQAALKVFAEKGTDAAKMADIAVSAGVGKGTLYEYFPSKEDLIAGSMIMLMDELDTHLGARLYPLADPLEKIRIFLAESCEFFINRPGMVNVLTDFWAAGIPRRGSEPLIKDLDKRFLELCDWLASIIDEGVSLKVFRPIDSRRLASILLAIVDGLLFQAMMDVLPKDLSRLLDTMFESLLEGIKV